MARVPTREIRICRRVRTTSGELLPAGSDRTGRRDLTRQIPTGNGRNGPAMRPRHPHAAESGVGKHTARESEAPNSVSLGKSAWRTPTPKFGPGTARSRGLIVWRYLLVFLGCARFATTDPRHFAASNRNFNAPHTPARKRFVPIGGHLRPRAPQQ